MILAGDIGGTHTRLALFDGDPHEPLALASYPSRKHAGLAEIVAAFLAEHPAEVDCACFDVAGPVRNGRVKTTNLPWIVGPPAGGAGPHARPPLPSAAGRRRP